MAAVDGAGGGVAEVEGSWIASVMGTRALVTELLICSTTPWKACQAHFVVSYRKYLIFATD
jgi:hypothetical protein